MPDFKVIMQRIFTLRRLAIGSIMVCAAIALLILFDNALMPWYTKHGEALAVPNIVTKRFEVAKEILENQGLVAIKSGEKHDINLPFGYVVEQNPRANRLVKLGRRVYLTISVGEPEVEVPDLINISKKNAIERIKSYGLRVGVIDYQFMANVDAEAVFSQSEPAGSLVKASTSIDIIVSNGPPTANVTVPTLLGKTLEVAKQEIAKAGMSLGEINYQVNEQFLPNTVIEQSIQGGTSVKFYSKIDLLATTISQR